MDSDRQVIQWFDHPESSVVLGHDLTSHSLLCHQIDGRSAFREGTVDVRQWFRLDGGGCFRSTTEYLKSVQGTLWGQGPLGAHIRDSGSRAVLQTLPIGCSPM
ncbi:hypothetical protein BJY04DRAFT_203745 [Aspergillus karnatakaensis]|uniref:uncharacterized protein n=1 Tax=Aspergillus karnatakaensis TaxID=1810916 RepID=UPI003CCD7303